MGGGEGAFNLERQHCVRGIEQPVGCQDLIKLLGVISLREKEMGG